MEKRIIKIKENGTSDKIYKIAKTQYERVRECISSGDKEGLEREFEDINISGVFNQFMVQFPYIKKPTSRQLKLAKRIIKILKYGYSNAILIYNDEIYDLVLDHYKKFDDEPVIEAIIMERRQRDIVHTFPELKGTLNKAHSVYVEKDKRSIEQFVDKCFENCDTETITISRTKKFDGVSIVGTIVNGRIVSAISRGESGKGTDLTHLFNHIKYRTFGDIVIGVKFECCITKSAKAIYEKEKGSKYANCRSAVISIVSASDGARYGKYLTLVPLETSMPSILDINEIFGGDIENVRLLYTTSNKAAMMDAIERYIDSVIRTRDVLDFEIDGVVLDCLDESVRRNLGRKNNINEYSVAYKFPPLQAMTTVKDVTFTVGRTGLIVPMVHYDKVSFSGTTHTKSSLSSYKRFKSLKLKKGDLIMVSYNNDVMPYVSGITCEQNNNNPNALIQMTKTCDCGYKLVLDGANLYCRNPLCEYKIIPAFDFFYKKLGVRDISEKTISKFYAAGIFTSYFDLISPDYGAIANMQGFKHKKIRNIEKEIKKLVESEIPMPKFLAALGIAGETICTAILSHITLDKLLVSPHKLYKLSIPGVAQLTKESFLNNLETMSPIIQGMRLMLNLVNEDEDDGELIEVAISGFRDKNLVTMARSKGYKVIDKCKKTCKLLIVKDATVDTSSTKKAKGWGIPIITYDEFVNKMIMI